MTKVKMRHPRSGKTMEASASAYKRIYQKQDWELVQPAATLAPEGGVVNISSDLEHKLMQWLRDAIAGEGEGTIQSLLSEVPLAESATSPDSTELTTTGEPSVVDDGSGDAGTTSDEGGKPEQDSPEPDPTAATKAAGGQKGRSSRGGQRKGSAQRAKSEGGDQ